MTKQEQIDRNISLGLPPHTPVVATAEWWQRLEAIAGRPLTDAERARADALANGECRGLLRPVADRLFGAAHVDAYFAVQP